MFFHFLVGCLCSTTLCNHTINNILQALLHGRLWPLVEKCSHILLPWTCHPMITFCFLRWRSYCKCCEPGWTQTVQALWLIVNFGIGRSALTLVMIMTAASMLGHTFSVDFLWLHWSEILKSYICRKLWSTKSPTWLLHPNFYPLKLV